MYIIIFGYKNYVLFETMNEHLLVDRHDENRSKSYLEGRRYNALFPTQY